MSEARKLYVNKPKKAQLKQSQQQLKGMEGQSSSVPSSSTTTTTAAASTASSSTGSGYGGSSKPPESFARRYKFVWPLLLGVNLAVGAYLFLRTKKKDVAIEDEVPEASPSSPTPASTAITDNPTAILPIVAQPLTTTEAIPSHQQRELFKWMLEEKRKIKTRDPEEKKCIDEEKAILKQFIRSKSIPNI